MRFEDYGITKRYPHIPFSERIRAFIQLVRPFTLLPALIAGTLGILICLAYYGVLEFGASVWLIIVLAALSLMLVQAFGQVLNQYADVGIDAINKPYRPIPSGFVSPREALAVAVVFGFAAIFLSFLINDVFALFCVAGLFMGVAYNLEPLRLKKRLWVNLVSLAFSRGLLPFVMMWSVFGDLLDSLPWVLGGFAFLVALFGNGFKDFPDIKGDKKFHMRTLPVVFGERSAIRIMGILAVFPFMYLLVMEGFGFLSTPFLSFFLLVPIFLVMLHDYDYRVPFMENSLSWVCFYVCLGLCYIIPFVVMVI